MQSVDLENLKNKLAEGQINDCLGDIKTAYALGLESGTKEECMIAGDLVADKLCDLTDLVQHYPKAAAWIIFELATSSL